MDDLRYDLDPQGDTILVLRCPNTKQPVWEPKDEATKLTQKNKTRRKLFGLDSMADTDAGPSDEILHEPTAELIAPTIESNMTDDDDKALSADTTQSSEMNKRHDDDEAFFGLECMSDTDAGPSDEVLHEPTAELITPTIESNVPNDSVEAHEVKSDRSEVEFRLSSRHLALASPVFKTMLNGFWKESTPSSDQYNRSDKPLSPLQNDSNCQVRYELAATEWGAEDFLLLMNIVHCQSIKVPYSIDLETLGRLSVLVDYYQCQEVTQFFAGLWIDKLSGSLPTTYGRDCVNWMFVSWVFSRSEIFEKMTQLAIRTCDGGLGTINLPFPPMLLSAATPHLHDLSKLMCFAAVMEQKRDHFVDEIFNVLGKLCKDISGGGRGCNFECRSMLLGSLLTEMDKNELYGPCSAERAKFAALSLKSGTWYSRHSNYTSHYYAHSCSLNALLKPSIERLWDDLDGLKLDDHKLQRPEEEICRRKFIDLTRLGMRTR
ncbi:hypothetical protein E4U15_002274 [Claviceps sp. LM218 group G6]|nr:hypothetical protein E4U15_002274 [Claviceps sp. LM218 group G6]